MKARPRTGPHLLGVVVGTIIFAAVVGGGLGAIWAPLTWLWIPTLIVVGTLGLVAWWAGLHTESLPPPKAPPRHTREPRASDLASDAQRENVARQLREAHAVGRLDADELEARAARAYQARTVGQLAALIDDVP